MNYKKIEPPYVDLGFYYDSPDWESFERLYRLLITLGATPIERTVVLKSPNARSKTFDRDSSLLEMESIQQRADTFFGNPDIRVLIAKIANAVGSIEDTIEELSYAPISAEAVGKSWHPITITVDGSWMIPEEYMTPKIATLANRASKQIWNRFYEIVSITKPLYAGINVEDTLRSPSDLAGAMGTPIFGDFYISGELLNSQTLNQIIEWVGIAYIKVVDDGLFVSVSPYPEIEEQNLQESSMDLWERSRRISKLLYEQLTKE